MGRQIALALLLSSGLALTMAVVWIRDGGEAIWGLLFSLLILALVLWSLSRLRQVGLDDEALYLTQGQRETRVPFAEVVAVRPLDVRRHRMVELRLSDRVPEKRWVWFRARYDTDDREPVVWYRRPHPIVEELRARIGEPGAG